MPQPDSTLLNLSDLEARLAREAPALNWKCEPVRATQLLNGTELPEQIQIRATRGGVPIRSSPFYLSGECLVRWGLDVSANLICNQLTPAGIDWDRLAEI